MKPLEFENEERIEDESEYLLETEMEGFGVEYRCEECDYRWTEKKQPYLSDQDRTGTRLMIDDSSVVCPMCGSHHISRV